MKKRTIIFPLMVLFSILTFFYCGSEAKKDVTDEGRNGKDAGNGYIETYKKTGWISENRYRAVVYILTLEECKNSTREQILEKMKFEAERRLQMEAGITFNRNQHARIKNLLDNYGEMTPDVIDCKENNIFYFDIEKENLQMDLNNIRNTK